MVALERYLTHSLLDRVPRFSIRLGIVLLLLFGAWTTVTAAPPSQSAQEGAALFGQKCASCHSIGGGRLVGPDLQGVGQRREEQFLVGYITDPAKLRQSGDPTAAELAREFGGIMPSTGVTDAQARSILAHIDAQSQGTGAGQTSAPPSGGQPQTQQPPATSGNPSAGASLFGGTTAFQNGGPSCLSCHDNAALGQLGGGTLGPDLTQVFGRLGATGLASVLSQIAFPTMIPVYAGHPLTAQEQADLVAFSEATANTPPVSSIPTISFFTLAALAVFVLALYLISRGRLSAVRRSLVTSQRRKMRV